MCRQHAVVQIDTGVYSWKKLTFVCISLKVFFIPENCRVTSGPEVHGKILRVAGSES